MPILQSEFEYLLKLDKTFEEDTELIIGPPPQKWSRNLLSEKNKRMFILDINRRAIEIQRFTYNKRYKQTIVLLRYDSMGRHTNPDGEVFDGPHVHIYKEGYDDKFAYPVSKIGIDKDDTIDIVLTKFLKYCNVKKIPNIQTSMF